MLVQYEDLRTLPFAFGGRYPAALDCFGLLLEVFRRNGIRLPDLYATAGNNYGRDGNGDGNVNWAIESMFNFGSQWTRVEKPHEGSVLVISFHGKVADHCGLALDDKWFVHAAEKVGVVVQPIRALAVEDRLKGIYDYSG